MGKVKELFMELDEINTELSRIIGKIADVSDSLDICKEDVKWFTENAEIFWCFDEFGYQSDSVLKVVDAYWFDLTDLLDKMTEEVNKMRMFDYLDDIERIQCDLDIWSMPNLHEIRQLFGEND